MTDFDFSAYNHHAPKGMRIIEANKRSLTLVHVKTGKSFKISKSGVDFVLHVMEPKLSPEFKPVMRAELHRLLSLVGYNRYIKAYRLNGQLKFALFGGRSLTSEDAESGAIS